MGFSRSSLALMFFLQACSGERVASGNYDVSSNCPGSQTSGTLELKQKTIYSTSSYNYEASGATAFGFASDLMTRDGDALTCASDQKSCAAVVAGEKVKEAAFICRDATTGKAVCSIVIRNK